MTLGHLPEGCSITLEGSDGKRNGIAYPSTLQGHPDCVAGAISQVCAYCE